MWRRHSTFAWVLAFGVLFAARLSADASGLDPRIDAAVALYREQGAEKALPVFERLAEEFAKQGAPHDRAAALHYVGECHWRLGQFNEAHKYLDRALAVERSSGDRLAEGKTANVLGLLAWDEGNYAEAIANFRKAGAIARAAGDRKLEGSSLNNLSLVYDEQGDYDTSLKQYRQVLEIYRDADFPRGVGDTLGNIGGVYLLLGHFREALGYYQQALVISQQLKSATSMSQDHGNIGLCLLGLGEVDAALGHLDQAIALAKQAGMQQDQAYWTRAKGNGLIQKGLYDRGLQSHRAALAIYEQIGAQAELVEALHDMGHLHLLLGDSASAERDFTRALMLSRSVGLDRGITENLVALGDLEMHRTRPDAAASDYEQARQRSAGSGQQQLLAKCLLRLARVNRAQQKFAEANAETSQALTIARAIGARDLEAEALYSRAELARAGGNLHAALNSFAAAEAAQVRIGDPDLLWQIHFGRARTQEAQGNFEAAVASLQAAVKLIEDVRSRLQEPRFRSGYVDDKFAVYQELMRLQLQLGRTEDAFVTAERLRARSFVEQLSGRATYPLSDADRRKETLLRERVRRLQRSMTEEGDDGGPSHPERAVERFSAELQQVEKEYQAFLDDHSRLQAGAGAAVAVPDTLRVQRRLGEGEALLEYVVAPESLVVFVVTARGIVVRTLPVKESDLVARVALLRDLIRRPGDDRWTKPAARLAAELIDPLEADGWLKGATRLYIVPHDVLTYLPFALLPRHGSGAGELLIDRYTIAYLPAAAALLRDTPDATAAGSMLAVAPARGGLRYAPQEARAADALFQPQARMLLGANATESQFKQLAGKFRVLHLATHGDFNAANPLLSGLELEADRFDDGMLQVHEVLDLHLHADLVTLSACDTAMGSGYFAATPTGDEFIGMNRAFLIAGSASVLATLWQVDDRASVSLMQRFYQQLIRSGADRSAATALALAQRALHRSPELGHPYYWAPYVVVGGTGRTLDQKSAALGRTS